MVAIAQNSTIGAALPLLDVFVVMPTGIAIDNTPQVPGLLTTPYFLGFAIYDISDDDKRIAPVQTFPGSGLHTVDLTADKLSLGRYAAAWSCPSNEPLGAHEIRWTIQLLSSSTPVVIRREFDVLAGVAGLQQAGYALVSDFRSVGVSATQVSDARLQRLIADASNFAERITRRFFEPRRMVMTLDGTNARQIGLLHPIIGIEDVSTIDVNGGPNAIDLTAIRIYNRHLTQGLLQPDDRSAPRIEFMQQEPLLIGQSNTYYPAEQYFSGYFPRGTQNIQITGVFGYTDPDDVIGGAGDTPSAIREAVKLLVMRKLPVLSDAQGRFDAQQSHRLISERTREQQYQLAPGKAGLGPFTTDYEIDSLLEQYCDVMQIGST